MNDSFYQLEADPAYWRGRAFTRFAFAGSAASDDEHLHHLHQGAIYERIAADRAREKVLTSLQPALVTESPLPSRLALRAAG